MSFVNLHVHTAYSILDGAARVPELVSYAVELGQPGVAITDHGSLGGAYSLYKECLKHDIKPIIGCEFYQSPSDATTKSPVFWGDDANRGKDVSGAGSYTHLTVVATTATGLRNLFKLQARAYTDGFYRKPRIDFPLLREYSSGLVVLSGCMGSAISTRIRLGQVNEAEKLAEQYAEIFPGRFYIELMYHGNPEDDALNSELVSLGRRMDLPFVFTNDSHYTTPSDAYAHEALCCLATGRKLSEGSFFKDAGSGFHLCSYDEAVQMCNVQAFPSEAISNTVKIAEEVSSYEEVFDTSVKMPKAILQTHPTADLELRHATMEGAGPELLSDPDFADRIAYELDTINALGYADYFLVVHDILREARRRGIRTNTRGSAAGCVTAYALKIHDINSLNYGLVFERFLNPSRASLPDFDIDIDSLRRDELLLWISERYGYDMVAQLGAYGYIKAKRAIDDSARLLGRSVAVAKELKGCMPPPKFGRTEDLDWKFFQDIDDDEEKLADADFSQASHRDVIELATKLEGSIRVEGIHAAGVIITPQPIYELMPVRRPATSKFWVTSFANPNTDPQIEALGFVKFDFLGLRNLGVISDCLSLLSEQSSSRQRGEFQLPCTFDDPKTFELLSRGDTLGVFQLDSSGMRGLLRKLRPRSLADITAVLALFRPGPMGVNAHLRYAERRPSSIHPELEETLDPILNETYGLIVYQEQVLDVLKVICGWSYAEADLVFNAMRKKLTEKMEAAKPVFYDAGKSRGFSESALSKLWDTLVPFADYSFNKAHATSYAIVAYQTAYLKANYGPAYMATLLGSVANDPNRLPRYLHEVERMGIELLPPDINTSGEGFTLDGQSIRYGISAIRGVGETAYKHIAKGRPYKDLTDYLTRAKKGAINSGTVTALAKAGAFDGIYPHRQRLLAGDLPELVIRGASVGKMAAQGQLPVVRPTLEPSDAFITVEEARQAEREALGTVVTRTDVTLRLKRPLTQEEWLFVAEIAKNSPGRNKIMVRLPSGRHWWTGGTISLTPMSRQALGVLPLEVEE